MWARNSFFQLCHIVNLASSSGTYLLSPRRFVKFFSTFFRDFFAQIASSHHVKPPPLCKNFSIFRMTICFRKNFFAKNMFLGVFWIANHNLTLFWTPRPLRLFSKFFKISHISSTFMQHFSASPILYPIIHYFLKQLSIYQLFFSCFIHFSNFVAKNFAFREISAK